MGRLEMEDEVPKLYRAQGRALELRIVNSLPRQIDGLLDEFEREKERENARSGR